MSCEGKNCTVAEVSVWDKRDVDCCGFIYVKRGAWHCGGMFPLVLVAVPRPSGFHGQQHLHSWNNPGTIIEQSFGDLCDTNRCRIGTRRISDRRSLSRRSDPR